MEKLDKYLGGVKNMKTLPKAMFIVDPHKERIAVAEARKLNIPTWLSLIPTATPTRSITSSPATTTLSALSS